ncbi:MAG: efflux RND transporter periplasmic adaptor subunit [Duncaniella sp.]|nr:efflux RND transporter periplasmic adaptor subunit [Duncaniella sp.]
MFLYKAMKINFLSLTVLGLGLSAAMLSSCSGKGQQQGAGAMPAPEISTMVVSASDTRVDNTFPATIKGKTDIAIRPQVTGFITKVHVDEGDYVRKGQVLFTLDQVQFNAAVDQARAQVNSAQAAVNTAQLTADNKKHLLDKNIISEYEYQMAANQLSQAKASLATAQAALVTAQKNLAYTTVTAPSDGVVGSIPNREGSLASPSSMEPLTTVSDNSQVYAYFSLTEKEALDLVGNGATSLNAAIAALPAVQLRLADGSVYPLEGKIATVSGVIDPTTGASNVRALFSNPSGVLRSGSTGTIVLPTYSENVITIPQRATSELQDRRFAYVINDSNKVVQTVITVEDMNDGRNFIVTSGLKPGDRIATEGIGTTVKPGITITPKEAAAAQAPEAPAAE